ncbi:MAG: glycosyltransferase [Anaerolineales bacterium]
MAIYLVLALLWMIAMIALFFLFRDRFRSLGELTKVPAPGGDPPEVTIIIPARNEEHNIDACLQGLLHQDYPPELLRILVVDDQSEDHTAAIVERMAKTHPQLRLLSAPPLPEGWHGKQHACWHGAQAAQGEWLCFVDADTKHSPELISAAIIKARDSQLDLLSLHPYQEMKSFWERLLMPVPLMSLMLLLDARRINDSSTEAAIANGQFILIRRQVYFAVDGHKKVRSTLLDDVELSRLVKRNGYRIAILGGDGLIRTRMYRDLPTLWGALARNGSELFGPVITSFAVLNAFFGAVFPLGYPLWLAALLENGGNWLSAAALIAALIGTTAWYATHAMAFRIFAVPPGYLCLLPISDLLIGIINLDGLIQRLRGRRTWKGRRI